MVEAKEITSAIPSYRETLAEIGRQLWLRKKILAKRILFMIWPPVIAAVSLVFLNYAYKSGWLNNWKYKDLSLVAISAWLVFSLFYYYIVSFIFGIEKRIWVDSFFDKRNLEPKDSWRIAKKLILPYLRVQFGIFWRYVLPAIVIFYLFIFVAVSDKYRLYNLEYFPVVGLALTFSIGFYFVYIPIILRYVPFIFLDRYGTEKFSYSGVFKENRLLKKIESDKTHVRTLVAHLSADAVMIMTSEAGANMVGASRKLGVIGEAVGVTARITAEEIARQTTSVGKIVTVYMLYQFARQKVYSEPQHVNEFLYKL